MCINNIDGFRSILLSFTHSFLFCKIVVSLRFKKLDFDDSGLNVKLAFDLIVLLFSSQFEFF